MPRPEGRLFVPVVSRKEQKESQGGLLNGAVTSVCDLGPKGCFPSDTWKKNTLETEDLLLQAMLIYFLLFGGTPKVSCCLNKASIHHSHFMYMIGFPLHL